MLVCAAVVEVVEDSGNAWLPVCPAMTVMSGALVPGSEYGRSAAVYVQALLIVSGLIAPSLTRQEPSSNSAWTSIAGMNISTAAEVSMTGAAATGTWLLSSPSGGSTTRCIVAARAPLAIAALARTPTAIRNFPELDHKFSARVWGSRRVRFVRGGGHPCFAALVGGCAFGGWVVSSALLMLMSSASLGSAPHVGGLAVGVAVASAAGIDGSVIDGAALCAGSGTAAGTGCPGARVICAVNWQIVRITRGHRRRLQGVREVGSKSK